MLRNVKVILHADKAQNVFKRWQRINGKTKEDRIAEGAKIINMAFARVAVAA